MAIGIDTNIPDLSANEAGAEPLSEDSNLSQEDFNDQPVEAAEGDAGQEAEQQEEQPEPEPKRTGLPEGAYRRIKGLADENKSLKEKLARYEGAAPVAADPREDAARKKLLDIFKPVLGPVLEQNARITDRFDRDEFWAERDYVPEDVRSEVEETLASARAEGVQATRQDAYYLVMARRADEQARGARQKVASRREQVARVNSKAKVVTGSSPARKAPKSLDQMTSAEIEQYYKDIPG